MPSIWVFVIACTCHLLFSSNPRLASMKAFTTSLVGDVAVKSAGSGFGNSMGAAGAACACGAVAGAGEDGASCWALILEIGRKRATSIAALARRADGRIKRFSFIDGDFPLSSLYLNLDGDGKPTPHAKRL